MPRTAAALLAAVLLHVLAGTARPGEEPKPPEAKPGIFASANWADSQAYAVKAPLVVIGKVTDPGKPAGKGWNQNMRGDGTMATIELQQELVLEVTEVLRGKLEPGRLTVKIQKVSFPMQFIYPLLNRMENGRWVNRQSLPAAEFALSKDRTYVLFLAEAKVEKGKEPGAAEARSADMADGSSPAEDPDAQLVASVRAFCRALADWASPPKLAADEEARIKALVADLGSDDFDKREAAEAELRKTGARAKVQLEAAAKDPDPERSFRARELLKAAEPVPGRTELPGGAPAAPKPDVMKKRPEAKPELEVLPAPVPVPMPAPAPLPPAAAE
ncbi:MAG TPA: hypothetical protein PK280_14265 [Planctomycetota bacterium]|nr:hypothetical protein [Planctomycetota bacterium]